MANIMTLKVVLLEKSLKGPTAVRFKGVSTREYLWSSRSKGFFIVCLLGKSPMFFIRR